MEKKTEKPKCRGCKKGAVKSSRSKWCSPCYKKRRRKQLKANNVVWRARVRKGTAGHHVRYRRDPTEWAAANKEKAIKQAKKYKLEAHATEAIAILEKVGASPQLKKRKPKAKKPKMVILKRVEKPSEPEPIASAG